VIVLLGCSRRECEFRAFNQMMTVVDDVLVIEEKGIYSVENS
jgi:hypothetical protein